jgi:hypothetical protein
VRYVPQQQWPRGSLPFSQIGDEYIRSTWKLSADKEIPNYFMKKGCSDAPIVINRIWTVMGANPCLCGENPQTGHLSHDTAKRERKDWMSVSLLVGEVPGSSCRADKLRGAFLIPPHTPSLSGQHTDWQRYTSWFNTWLTECYSLLHITLSEAYKRINKSVNKWINA